MLINRRDLRTSLQSVPIRSRKITQMLTHIHSCTFCVHHVRTVTQLFRVRSCEILCDMHRFDKQILPLFFLVSHALWRIEDKNSNDYNNRYKKQTTDSLNKNQKAKCNGYYLAFNDSKENSDVLDKIIRRYKILDDQATNLMSITLSIFIM